MVSERCSDPHLIHPKLYYTQYSQKHDVCTRKILKIKLLKLLYGAYHSSQWHQLWHVGSMIVLSTTLVFYTATPIRGKDNYKSTTTYHTHPF